MRKLILALFFLLTWTTAKAECPSCGDSPDFKKLPQSCTSQVELVIQNSLAYGPQDLKKILAFVNRANKRFYRCSKYEIAVGDDITVIVDTERGIIYLTRYIFRPEEK